MILSVGKCYFNEQRTEQEDLYVARTPLLTSKLFSYLHRILIMSTKIINKKHEAWQTNHICTNTIKLPSDCFQYSIFGHSTAHPPQQKEPHVKTLLNTERFKQLGFPENFTHQRRVGVPLLMHTIPPKKRVNNYASILDHEVFARETLTKWETLGVFTGVDYEPHIVHALGVA